ncbi:MAG: hypothetical protein HYW80_00495, partial [Parcubacteria group bacterium]|nr:hypothetical protein [Parcubacteria group bacterium]
MRPIFRVGVTASPPRCVRPKIFTLGRYVAGRRRPGSVAGQRDLRNGEADRVFHQGTLPDLAVR